MKTARKKRTSLITTMLSALVILSILVLMCGCSQTAGSSGSSSASSVSSSTAESESRETSEDSSDISSESNSGTSDVNSDQAALKTVTDMTGRSVEVKVPAERVLALTAGECEIVYALGGVSSLAGRGEYCDYPEEILELPSVQSGSELNIEQILALEPDVVVMSTMSQTKEQVQQLEDAGIPVLVTQTTEIIDVYSSIKMIGAALGRDHEAEELISSMETTFDEIKASSEAYAGKTIYFEVSPLEYGLWTAGKDTFMDEIAQAIGLTNIFNDVDGWAEISQEQVIERNPDYILTITISQDDTDPADEICSRTGWENITAVRNRAILNLTGNELSRPSQRLADGALLLKEFLDSCSE